MKTVGELIDYLSKFPRNWRVSVTRSDEGGDLISYLEGGQGNNEIVLTTEWDDTREG